jgi:hypothetical protein
MRLEKTLLAFIFFIAMACSPKREGNLFVFVGNMMSSDTVKNADGFVRLKYKILERTYGENLKDTIEIFAYYDSDSLKFTKHENVLLFVYEKDKRFYKLATPWYAVHRATNGRWASGAQSWDYTTYPTTIKPGPIQFQDSVSFDTRGMSQEEIDHWYPEIYYERKDGKAIPLRGNYTNELFEIQKNGFLKDANLLQQNNPGK